ncbi:ABC transporter permease [Clostridium sp. 'White wine YQ']|uniref:ABC transporter permease n=1 Tax=Clostridium sp. 'White wine YQ' TaxID=3027474 RepID=UPI00236617B3|nr:ABC transporter permease subunit [Clostridium sp. 'White wine YQ']MDD7796318.1 ABC transporter permease [Clostridium sp. 'White wine YQ']
MISIAAATFKEALRKKILILVAAFTFVYLTLFGLITHFAVEDLTRTGTLNTVNALDVASNIVSFLGFYFSSMLVAFLTIMVSVGSISSEVESGVIHSIITRPIKRSSYVLGKYIGMGILAVLYGIFLFVAIISISTIFKLPIVNTIEPLNIIKGLLFFTLEPIAILSLSIFGSASFKTLSNGIFIISIYILGLIGGVMEVIGSMLQNQSLVNLGIISSLISPFDIIYRQMLSAMFEGISIRNPFMAVGGMTSTTPSIWMIIYILAYIPGLVLMAIRKFSLKDIS